MTVMCGREADGRILGLYRGAVFMAVQWQSSAETTNPWAQRAEAAELSCRPKFQRRFFQRAISAAAEHFSGLGGGDTPQDRGKGPFAA